jgi:hypothetical protein
MRIAGGSMTKTDSTEGRVSVLVAQADIDWSKWKEQTADERDNGVLRLVQDAREDANDFAMRVAERVERLGRQSAMLERYSLVVQDGALQNLRSEVLSAVTLLLISSPTPLTIRFAGEHDDEVDAHAVAAVV